MRVGEGRMQVGEGRWPPVYDAEDLAKVIHELVRSPTFAADFWTLRAMAEPLACQGDVVRLVSAIPEINEVGDVVANEDCDHWLLLGNTCDLDRTEVKFTAIVPLVEIGEQPREHLARFQRYEYSRRFYVPPWPTGDRLHRFADFTRMVALEKSSLGGAAVPIARMAYPAWVLLHSCLVRYLARDDGRNG
jgi:hypothetical protein